MKFTRADAGRRFVNKNGDIDRVPTILPEGSNFKSQLGWWFTLDSEWTQNPASFEPVSWLDEPKAEAASAPVEPAPTTELKLEVGKKYRRRDGSGPVTIIKDNGHKWTYRFRADTDTGYMANGRYYKESEDSEDLVALWEEPAAEAAPAAKMGAALAEKVQVGHTAVAHIDNDGNLRAGPAPAEPTTTVSVPAVTYQGLIIRALQHGGFVVAEAVGRHEYCGPVAAFSTVAEAAAFITAHLSAEGK